MPINPNDPNQPNDPQFDVNKYLNFDQVREKIDSFFSEMLNQLQAPFQKSMSEMESSADASFKKMGTSGKHAFTEVAKAAGSVMDALAEKAKSALEAADYKEIESRLIASRQAVDAAQRKEDAEFQKARLSYLKEILSKEEYNIHQILAERDKLLDHIDDEYVMQRNYINAEIKDQQMRNKELIRLDTEREKKKAELRTKFSAKEREARGEIDFGAAVKGKILKDADDIGMKMLGFAKNLNYITVALGAAIAVFNMGVRETQRQARLLVSTRGALGTGAGQQGAGLKAFQGLLGDASRLGFKPDQIEEFVTILAESPKALKEAATVDGQAALRGFRDMMGGFGVDVTTSMKLISTAGREWNMSSKDLTKTLKVAIGINKMSGLGVKDSFNSLVNLNAQLRSLTFNGQEAAKILVSTVAPMKEMGFSDEEVNRFNQSLAQMLTTLSPSKLAGLFSFTQGRMPTREDFQRMADGGGQLQMVADTFLKVIGDKLGTSEGMFMIEKLGQQLGFSAATSAQGAAAWEKILLDMKSGKAGVAQGDAITKQMDEFRKKHMPDENELKEIQRKGFEAMSNMVSPMDKLASAFATLSTEIGQKLVPGIQTLNGHLNDILSVFNLSDIQKGFSAATKHTMQTQFPITNLMYETIKKNIPNEPSRERRR